MRHHFWIKLALGFALSCTWACSAQAQPPAPPAPQGTVTPNVGFQLPAYQQTNWQVPIDFNFNVLDSILGGTATLQAGTTTPTLGTSNTAWVTANTGAEAITNILGGYPGESITIFCGAGDSYTSLVAGSTISLSTTWSCPAGKNISLRLIGTVWTEWARQGAGGGGGGATLSTNGINNSSQSVLNFENSIANSVGLHIAFTNPSGGNELAEITGSSYGGNAATSTAFAATPTQCPTGQAPVGIAANGNVNGCASIASGLTTQTNGTNNISQTVLNLVNSSANTEGLTAILTNGAGGTVKVEIGGASYSGNAATASALNSTPTNCSGGQFALGINASGNANCGTPAGGGTIGGSIAAGQVGFGSGVNAIEGGACLFTPDGGSLNMCGPIPWVDVTAGTGYRASNLSIELTTISGLNTATLTGSAADFLQNDLIYIPHAGATPSSSAPTGVTVTPEPAGSTSYNYAVEGISQMVGITPYTDVTISTGPSSLTFWTYNEICWTHDSTTSGHLVYGRSGSTGSLTFIAYTDDDCYADTGAVQHSTLVGTVPTNPSASPVNGILEAKITNIAGSTYTLSVNAGATVSAQPSYHDGNPALQAAIEKCNTLSSGNNPGCAILFPWAIGADYTLPGNVILDQNHIVIAVSPGASIITYGALPILRPTGSRDYFRISDGNYFEKIMSIPTTATMNFPTFSFNAFTGTEGGPLFVAGQVYQPVVDNGNMAASNYSIEFGPSSTISKYQLFNDWFASSSLCSYIFSASSGAQGWHWYDNIFEGPTTSTCPGEGIILTLGENPASAAINGFGSDNNATSDVNPGTSWDLFKTQAGSISHLDSTEDQYQDQNGSVFASVTSSGVADLYSGSFLLSAEFHGGDVLNSTGGYIFNGVPCWTKIDTSFVTGTFTPSGGSYAGCNAPTIENSDVNGVNIHVYRMPVTFASLGACGAGIVDQEAEITDSTTNTWGATITGGGSDRVRGYCDGTNWTVMAK